LETLYPNRVDLGLVRAPGADQQTARILHRPASSEGDMFFNDIKQLIKYFGSEGIQGSVRAYPGVGLNVTIYILGSSPTSAHIAA
jgi:alkanesulfonate monooxygenase SsuD/methylene tetrahydromethanopterin reductase-like flavin-dependent oxidoreductase (luciferase family)